MYDNMKARFADGVVFQVVADGLELNKHSVIWD